VKIHSIKGLKIGPDVHAVCALPDTAPQDGSIEAVTDEGTLAYLQSLEFTVPQVAGTV
jgi:hypothetical protein